MQLIKILQYFVVTVIAYIISVSAHAYDYQSHGVGITRDEACYKSNSGIKNAEYISSCSCKNVKNTYWTCSVNVERKRVVYTPPPVYNPPTYSAPPRQSVTFSRPGIL